MKQILRLIVMAVVTVPIAAYGQKTKEELLDIFENSRAQTDFRNNGNAGLLLRGTIRVTRQTGRASDGNYMYLQSPDGHWEEIIELPGYKRTRSGDGKQFWQVRSQEEEEGSIEELENLIRSVRPPKIQETDRLSQAKMKGASDAGKECIKVEGASGVAAAYCFDDKTSDLVEVYSGHNTKEIPWKVDWKFFAKFDEWSGKRLPMLLEGYNGDQIATAAQLEVKALPKLSPDFFAKPDGATVWADCGAKAIWKIKTHVHPEYPAEARMRGQDGTVVVSGIIEEDGRISNIKPVYSRWPELYGAARAAVSQWRYERTPECGGSKGRTETFIDVIFSLRR